MYDLYILQKLFCNFTDSHILLPILYTFTFIVTVKPTMLQLYFPTNALSDLFSSFFKNVLLQFLPNLKNYD